MSPFCSKPCRIWRLQCLRRLERLCEAEAAQRGRGTRTSSSRQERTSPPWLPARSRGPRSCAVAGACPLLLGKPQPPPRGREGNCVPGPGRLSPVKRQSRGPGPLAHAALPAFSRHCPRGSAACIAGSPAAARRGAGAGARSLRRDVRSGAVTPRRFSLQSCIKIQNTKV